MEKEAIEIGLTRPRQTSFYDRHIRQKKVRLDMIICVILMVFLQIGIYFVVRYMTTPKHNNYPYQTYNNHNEYNDYNGSYSAPMYSYAPSAVPSGGYYYQRPLVDLGISGETSNVNRLVNEIKNTMTNKHEKNNVLSEGDIELTEEHSKQLMNLQSNASKTKTKETKTDIQPDKIIKTPKKKDDVNTIVNIMKDVNSVQPSDSEAKLLRAGPKVDGGMEANQLIYQFNPKKYDTIDINLPVYGTRVRSNLTVRQAPPTSTNKNIVVIINEYSQYKSKLSVDGRFDDGEFSIRSYGGGRRFFNTYGGGPDSSVTIEVIFPPQVQFYNTVAIFQHIGCTHLDKSLENINFNTVAVYTNYGAVVAEHIKAEKFVSTFFNGYLNGYFEVSKNIAVATYYGKIKPIVRFTSNDVHLLAIARYGTVDTHIDKNTFEGTIDIQSVDGLPIIYDTDLSSFKSSIMKPSPTLTRLETKYKSLTSDNHLLISGGKNATLTFGELNP
ncbi:unnamed protein product [Cunninghamella blakesleeana]